MTSHSEPLPVPPAARFVISPYVQGTGRFRVTFDHEAVDFRAEMQELLNEFWQRFPDWEPFKMVVGGNTIKRFTADVRNLTKAELENVAEAVRSGTLMPDESGIRFEVAFSRLLIEPSFDLDAGELMIVAHKQEPKK